MGFCCVCSFARACVFWELSENFLVSHGALIALGIRMLGWEGGIGECVLVVLSVCINCQFRYNKRGCEGRSKGLFQRKMYKKMDNALFLCMSCVYSHYPSA